MVVTSSNRNSHLWLGCVYSIYSKQIYYVVYMTTVQIQVQIEIKGIKLRLNKLR